MATTHENFINQIAKKEISPREMLDELERHGNDWLIAQLIVETEKLSEEEMIEAWEKSGKDADVALAILRSDKASLYRKIKIWKEIGNDPEDFREILENIEIKNLSREDLSTACEIINSITADEHYVIQFIQTGKFSTEEMIRLWESNGKGEEVAQAIVEQIKRSKIQAT